MKELAKTTNVPRECATLGLINKCVIFWLTTQKSEDGEKEGEEKGEGRQTVVHKRERLKQGGHSDKLVIAPHAHFKYLNHM